AALWLKTEYARAAALCSGICAPPGENFACFVFCITGNQNLSILPFNRQRVCFRKAPQSLN
ncbi:MAG TPA: hypothetical protein PKW73_04010, partial [Candidatus Obscuribacter sp.]|nr:hypothetical protein [Candidatus Obscuribacter sp.]